MQKYEEYLELNDEQNESSFSLGNLLPIAWHARRTIALVTTVSVIIGVSGSLFLPNYKSEGFMQFGGPIPLTMDAAEKAKDKDKLRGDGILLADFKRYAALFTASGRFNDYVTSLKLENIAGVDELHRIFRSPAGVGKLVEPVYPFTKMDAKELMDQPKDGSNNVIGLRISAEAGNPDTAQRMVGTLGRYAMDSIIYLIYSDALRFKHTEITSRITKLDNVIIDSKEKLQEYSRKGGNLKQIVARYPEPANQATRQIVAVTDENSRFLSPMTQLMTSEIEAAAANEAIYKAKHEQQQSILLREYYDRAKTLLDSNKSGEAVLRGLEPIKEAVFKDKDLSNELVKEVYNTITIENQTAVSLYLEKSRFIAGPNLPENRTVRLSTALLLSFLFGLVASFITVLARNWWRENHLKMQD